MLYTAYVMEENMRKTKSVASAIILAAAAIGINAIIPSQKNEDSIDVSKILEASSFTVTAANSPEYSGEVMLSSLSLSLVGSSNDSSKLNNSTGKTAIPVAGMSDVLRNATVNTNDVSASAEGMDVATKYVPEGSVIDGYTNLGVSNVTSYLNVRNGAGTSNKIIGKMPGGSACEILEEADGWYKIKSGDVTGYVSSDYILTGYDANVKAMETMEAKLLVTADVLNVREEPSTECSVSTKVNSGEYLDILEEESNGWYKIDINNLTGYVSADYVKKVYSLPTAVEIVEVKVNNTTASGSTNSGTGGSKYTGPSFDASSLDQIVSQTAKDLIDYSMNFLGNPYVYGGNSLTNGTDCSGFVKLIFAHFGYNLPRSSVEYASVGTQIPYTAAKPGDIMVYKYGSRIGHVAIYIGNGQIVHASTPTGGIRIGSAYFVTPCFAVRVIP